MRAETGTVEKEVEIEGIDIGFEDISGRRSFFIEIDSSEIFTYEKKFLSNNFCNAMLPMYFLKLENKERIYYDFTEYIQLEKYINVINRKQKNRLPTEEKAQIALSIMEQLLKGIGEAENCLLFMERYRFQEEVVFVNLRTGEVRIAYLPEKTMFPSTKEKLVACIESVTKVFQDTDVNYAFEKLTETMTEENLGIDGMNRVIGKMLRDFKITYAKDK